MSLYQPFSYSLHWPPETLDLSVPGPGQKNYPRLTRIKIVVASQHFLDTKIHLIEQRIADKLAVHTAGTKPLLLKRQNTCKGVT